MEAIGYNKDNKMTPYRRVIAALRGERTDKIPFTVYESKIPQCSVERDLRNRGLCIVKRINSYRIIRPNVKSESLHYTDEKGRYLIRTVYKTPYGELSTLDEPAGFTSWHHERLFKSADDYKALLFMIKDSVIIPAYENAIKIVKSLGEDFIVRDNLPLEPMQNLVSSYMGPETFSYEWMDNRDKVMELYEALVNVARKIYPIVAEGPLEFCNYGGNVIPQVIGVKNFDNYYVHHYNEAAEILHKKGKLIGCHMDADNKIIMNSIANTDLDYIEAYDPGISPSVKDARKVFGKKTLWINWPSAWHLNSVENVRKDTIKLIEEARSVHPGDEGGFIIGVTEDVPEERWRGNFLAIMDGIDEVG